MLRTHIVLVLVLTAAAIVFFVFPLRLQSMESYAYAAAIEKYYHIGTTFAVGSAGMHLPDFGRYHLNHPVGHAIAGFAFDYLNIPALSWMKTVNGFAAITSGLFFYLLLLRIGFSRQIAAATVAMFLSASAVWLAALSGDWHMPALALSIAGILQVIRYIEVKERRSLYFAALLLSCASCYHLIAFFLAIPVAIVVLFYAPAREHWLHLVAASAGACLLLAIVYLFIPFHIFRFDSWADFSQSFLIYKDLQHIRYVGTEWPLMALRTITHAFLFLPAGMRGADAIVAFITILLLVSGFFFSQSVLPRAMKVLFLLIPVTWFLGHWLSGARPDGVNGWMFISPFLCIIIMSGLRGLNQRMGAPMMTLPLLLFGWNFVHSILPNSRMPAEEAFYFSVPPEVKKATPVALVIGNPVLAFGEMWFAGSELGFRKQALFFPCCGERNYLRHLSAWMRANPGFMLASEGYEDIMEQLLSAEGLRYKRWSQRNGKLPEAIIPATIFFRRERPFMYNKRLTMWLPDTELKSGK